MRKSVIVKRLRAKEDNRALFQMLDYRYTELPKSPGQAEAADQLRRPTQISNSFAMDSRGF